MTVRKFGALRDVHDVRDRMYRASPRSNALPPQADLREWAGPVKDQGEEGSCTGHAFSSAREWIARKYEKSSPVLSPQCLYVEELLASGDFPNDEGAMPRTACQVLTALGCCETALYPYVAGNITRPTPEQVQNALKYRTGAYHRIASLVDFLKCVADPTPWPVLVGFTVYESLMSEQVAETGVMPTPQSWRAAAGRTRSTVSRLRSAPAVGVDAKQLGRRVGTARIFLDAVGSAQRGGDGSLDGAHGKAVEA